MASQYSLSFYKAPDHLRNFIFIKEKMQNRNSRNYSKIPFLKIPEHRTSVIDQLSRRKIIKNLEVAGDSDLIPQYTKSNSVPFRQYYHSRTNLPMHSESNGNSTLFGRVIKTLQNKIELGSLGCLRCA